MDDKIILFPNRKLQLERAIKQHMESEEYQAAIDLLEVLNEYNQMRYPSTIYYIIAYRKLNRLTEAELYGEELLSLNDAYYEEYTDLYLMILYEAEKYQKAMEYIEKIEGNETVSTNFQMKIQEMKQLLQQMIIWTSEEIMADFRTAVNNGDAGRQYVLLQKWRQLEVRTPQKADEYLADDTIHPIIKTILLEILMEEKVERTLNVEKFSSQISVVPKQLTRIKQNLAYQQTIELIEEEYQTNPSKAELMKEILEQYCFVMFPFLYSEEKVFQVFKTIATMVEKDLINTNENKKEDKLQQEIEICCHLYQYIMLQ